jgi:hypothetical protein
LYLKSKSETARIIERIPEVKNEKLLTYLKRGFTKIFAAKEILKRIKEGKIDSPEGYLRSILQDFKIDEKEARAIKEKAALLLKQKGLLTKRNILIIFDNLESGTVLNKIIKTYIREEEIPNYILKEMFQKATAKQLKETLGWKLLKQAEKADELLPIIYRGKGTLRIAALKKIKNFDVDPPDVIEIMESVPKSAQEIWHWLKEGGRLSGFPLEDLLEVVNRIDIPTIKLEAAETMLPRVTEKIQEIEKEREESPTLYENQYTGQKRKLEELKRSKKKIEKVIQELRKTPSETESQESNDMKMEAVYTPQP